MQRHHHPQFQIDLAPASRPFERLLLRHRWFHNFISCCGQTTLSLALYPRFIAPYRWILRRYPMPFPNLAPAFIGYKILFISDLHTGCTRQSFLRRVLPACLAEKPDLILLGGDLIDYHPDSLSKLAELLPLLHPPSASPPDGVCAIFGNHDYNEFSHRHNGPRSARRVIHKRLLKLLADSPVRVLRNESITLSRPSTGPGSAPSLLQIVGLDEMWTRRADALAAFAGLNPAAPTICLQHNPDGYESGPTLKNYPWHYLLCGHSHGGQINAPFLGPLYIPMQFPQYHRGFYDCAAPTPIPSIHTPPAAPARSNPQSNSQLPTSNFPRIMYVSTGIGSSEPLRLRVPPEAILFTLASV